MSLDFIKEAAVVDSQVIAWRHEFHANPECSFEEKKTTARLAEILRSMGYENVRVGMPGHPDIGVLADLNSDKPGKRVALRADIDALKVTEETDLPWKSTNEGVMHACGHDTHIAMLLGAAKIIADHKNEFAGKIRLIFQPGEEIGKGALGMIKAGALDGVDFIFGQHIWSVVPKGVFGVRPGAFMASADKFELTITGKGGHGSAPQFSIDPVVAACAVVQSWQTLVSRETSPLEAVVLSVCNITGGTLFNIIPSTAYMQGTTRTYNQKVRENVADRMASMAESICEAYRCEAEFTYHWLLGPTVNDRGGAEFVERELTGLFGAEHVMRTEPDMGGEDFSEYQKIVPGCFMFLGAGVEGSMPHHHPKFTVDDDVFKMGVAAMVALPKLWLDQNS